MVDSTLSQLQQNYYNERKSGNQSRAARARRAIEDYLRQQGIRGGYRIRIDNEAKSAYLQQVADRQIGEAPRVDPRIALAQAKQQSQREQRTIDRGGSIVSLRQQNGNILKVTRSARGTDFEQIGMTAQEAERRRKLSLSQQAALAKRKTPIRFTTRSPEKQAVREFLSNKPKVSFQLTKEFDLQNRLRSATGVEKRVIQNQLKELRADRKYQSQKSNIKKKFGTVGGFVVNVARDFTYGFGQDIAKGAFKTVATTEAAGTSALRGQNVARNIGAIGLTWAAYASLGLGSVGAKSVQKAIPVFKVSKTRAIPKAGSKAQPNTLFYNQRTGTVRISDVNGKVRSIPQKLKGLTKKQVGIALKQIKSQAQRQTAINRAQRAVLKGKATPEQSKLFRQAEQSRASRLRDIRARQVQARDSRIEKITTKQAKGLGFRDANQLRKYNSLADGSRAKRAIEREVVKRLRRTSVVKKPTVSTIRQRVKAITRAILPSKRITKLDIQAQSQGFKNLAEKRLWTRLSDKARAGSRSAVTKLDELEAMFAKRKLSATRRKNLQKFITNTRRTLKRTVKRITSKLPTVGKARLEAQAKKEGWKSLKEKQSWFKRVQRIVDKRARKQGFLNNKERTQWLRLLPQSLIGKPLARLRMKFLTNAYLKRQINKKQIVELLRNIENIRVFPKKTRVLSKSIKAQSKKMRPLDFRSQARIEPFPIKPPKAKPAQNMKTIQTRTPDGQILLTQVPVSVAKKRKGFTKSARARQKLRATKRQTAVERAKTRSIVRDKARIASLVTQGPATREATAMLPATRITPQTAIRSVISELNKTSPATAIKSKQLTSSKILNSQALVQVLKLLPRSVRRARKPRTPARTTRTVKVGLPKLPKFDNRKAKGYDVYARVKGRFVKVNAKPLKAKKSADAFGRLVTDNTLIASYVTVGTNKTPSAVRIAYPGKQKFRAPKRRSRLSPNTRIEKRKYRLDKQGERTRISSALRKSRLQNLQKARRVLARKRRTK